MAGDVVDSNSTMVAEVLGRFGWRTHKRVTVGDEQSLLCKEIDVLCEDAEVLLINGGLGPTVDDLTATALAEVCQRNIAEHGAALAHLQVWCQQKGLPLNASNYKQALLPEGCDIIANSRGSAVGICLEHRGCLVLATPGVPSELRQMLEEEIIPLLQQRFSSDFIRTRRLGIFGLGESPIQELINRQFPDWPASIDLGFRASMPVLEVKLTARGDVEDAELAHWQQKLCDLLSDHVLGELPINLAGATLNALRDNNLHLCTAESCTGGLIASQLTQIPGASEHYDGGVVSYSNEVKQRVLGVSEASLQYHGAVSETVVREMALGALANCGSNLCVAVTGIAGPDGGSEDKPVGTVWIAWGSEHDLKTQLLQLPFERVAFQQWVAALALDLLRRQILGLPPIPRFMRRYRVAAPASF